ncbi:MAG: DnaT-like ssDNA-binding protein [Candidatus Caldatribacteriota bacterium]|jgi:hypothetical protein
MSLVVGTNSYVSLNEAEEYLSDRYGYATWQSSEYQEVALISAARLLDTQLSWKYSKTESDQTMQWPRIGFDEAVFGFDEDTVPQIVKDAQCELAFDIIENGGIKPAFQTQDDIKRIKADTVELEYRSMGMQKLDNSRIPSHIKKMLKPFVSSIGVYRLERA